MFPRRHFLLFAAVLGLAGADAGPVISEFVASNRSGLQDEDGDRPDWIEIHNPGAAAVNLQNWCLTDLFTYQARWRFPAVSIPADGYLVVFASSKNRSVAGQPLHTNFALSADGEYLALVDPDGIVAVPEFAPIYPIQYPDYSYGTPSNTSTTTLIGATAPCRWRVPTSSTDPDFNTWRNPGFDDSGWTAATQGIGFDRNPSGVNYLPEIGGGGNTEAAMYNIRSTCDVRIPFSVANPASLTKLILRVKYDDGFAAYLNGQPLLAGGVHLKRNAPAALAWNSVASAQAADAAAVVYQDFDVTEDRAQLLSGGNLLALHALNRSNTSSDMVLRVELIGEVATGGAALPPGYSSTPTPGARNGGPASMLIPQEVVFSQAGGPFASNFNLTLGGMITGQVIRYTTDGTVPTASSAVYTAAIPVNSTILVRARVFDSVTSAAGLVGGRHYEKLDTTLTNYNASGLTFRSALPIVVLNNRGGGEIPNDNTARDVRLHVIDRDVSGYASISAPTALSLPAAAKIRGSSSAGFAKKSYGIEFRDESGEARAHPLLDMPAGEDWALISCYEFDRAFMRNAWVFEMARRSGNWSPRTRFVELWFNQDGDHLEYADYRGVYLLCENVRNGSDRADITPIEPGDVTQPYLSGGYNFKVDRFDADEFHWQTARGLPVNTTGNMLTIHRPKLADLPAAESSYLVGYFQQFEDTLYAEAAAGFTTRNYQSFIEPSTWADHNLLNMFAKNVDALRLSSYLLKDRGRRITGGPLWDFDRSANSTDSRDNDYNTWLGTGDGTNFFAYAWWEKLFADIEFRQVYVDRWQILRRGPLATAGFQGLLDSYLAEFRVADPDNPSTRDYARWYGSATSNILANEVFNMKAWLANRAAWIDSQFCPPPVPSPAAGPVNPGQSVTLTIPPGTTVYYTRDGSDPRTTGGGVRPGALTYTGTPLTLTNTTLVTARAFRSGSYATPSTNWSGPVTALYPVNEPYASASSLRVTAIHYNPLAPDAAEAAAIPDLIASDFEWLELANVSGSTIQLEGVQLAKGAPVSRCTLPAYSLAPGARALVVKHRAAFTLRYGSAAAARIVAEWTGDQSLDNGGERIWLQARDAATIASFAYDDGGIWPGRADGSGSALEYRGASQATINYQNGSLWNSSLRVHGTPGQSPPVQPSGVVFNEIVASAIAPDLAAIEFLYTSTQPVDLSGWYLSDSAAHLTADDFRKFKLPNGSVLAPGARRVFTEADFNPNGEWNPSPGTPADTEFPLDGFRGGTLWLISGQTGTSALACFEDNLEYTPTLSGVSHGRYPDGSGSFTPLANPSLGESNRTPRNGQLQVSEIMYYPAGSFEYVELVNTGTASQSLDQWTLRGDADFDFASGTTLLGGQIALVVAFDPVPNPSQATAFRAAYGVAEAVVLLGPWRAPASLADDAGTIRLRRRVPAPPDEPTFVGLMVEDEVLYQSSSPWPTGASGTGAAIHRLGIHRWGNDPSAWAADAPSAGSEAGGYAGWQRLAFPPGATLTAPGDDPDLDGLANAIEYMLGTAPDCRTLLPAGIAPVEGLLPERMYLDYTRRLDRDDYVLGAREAANLTNWLPASHDTATGVSGLVEARRAWLPLVPPGGFLRLQATAAPW